MPLQTRPTTRGRWALTAILASVLLPVTPAFAAPDAAPDAAPASAFTTTLSSPTSEVRVGEKVDVEIGYSCTGTSPCTDVVISLPRPAGLPYTNEYVSTQGAPVVTGSNDVLSTSTGYQGEVTFTMAQSIPAGTSGTLGVRYSTLAYVTANGTSLDVTATSTGSNVEPQTAQTSVLQTATPTTLGGQNYTPYPAYTDQDLRLSMGASTPYDQIGFEGMGTLSADLVLPAGAVFVSAETPPTSVSEDGLTLHWDDIKPGSTQSRWMEYYVRFPSDTFSDGQSVSVPVTLGGTALSGAALTPVTKTGTMTLKTFNYVFVPYAQLMAGSGVESGYNAGAVAARGKEIGVSWYFNNYNSTVPTTGSTTSLDFTTAFVPTRLARPFTEGDVLTVRWTTASGATGEFTTADYPADSSNPTFTDLGVPAGDRITHLDIDHPGSPATGSTNSPYLFGVVDGAQGSRITLNSSVRFSAAGFDDVTRNAAATIIVADPHPVASVSLQAASSGTAVRPGQALDWTVSLWGDSVGGLDLEPVLYFPLPKGTRLAETPVTMGGGWSSVPVEFSSPETTVVHNASLDQDVLVIRWPGASLADRAYLPMTIHTVLGSAPAGTLRAAVYAGDARGPVTEFPYNVDSYNRQPADSTAVDYAQRVRDDRDVDGDGTVGGTLARAVANASTGTGAGLRSQLEARGSLDTDFVVPPGRAATESGEDVTYRLPIENTGNIALTDIVIYDILPFVGDTGVSGAAASLQRGSQFAPRLAGPVSAPEGFEVWYSTSTNPCRPEVYPGQGACDDDWTQTPTDIGATRAIKLVQTGGAELVGGATTSATWSMAVAQDVAAGSLAVNSAAFSATRTDNGQQILAEPAFSAVEVAQADLSVRIDAATWSTGAPQSAGLHVANAGPTDAPAHLEIELPEGVDATVVAARDASAAWSCTVDDTLVTCDAAGMIASGSESELPVTVLPSTPLAGTTVEVTAQVTGTYPDLDLTNNAATAEIAITEESPVDPNPEPTDPGTDPTDPTVDPTDPGTDPTDPGTDPTDPSVDPTDPSVDPTDPGTDPTIDPAGPGTDPSDGPSDGAATPTSSPTSAGSGGSGTSGTSGTAGTATDGTASSTGSGLASTGASVGAAVVLAAVLVLGGLMLRRRRGAAQD